MADRVRHHYIPRIMLKRFSSWSDPEGRKHKIWQISKQRGAKEVSTKDVAVKKYMYGDNDELESALSQIEGEFSKILKHIDAGEPPSKFKTELTKFVWLQSWRTHAIRFRIQEILQVLLHEMGNKTNSIDFYNIAYAKGIPAFWENVSSLDSEQYVELQRRVQPFDLATFAELLVLALIASGKFSDMMRYMTGILSAAKFLDQSSRSAFNKSISMVVEGDKLGEVWNLDNWDIWKFEGESLIIGDCCVLCAKHGGEIGPVRDAENWDYAILPIDPTSCLVGAKKYLPRKPSASNLNLYSSRSSSFEFYSCKNDDLVTNLIENVGTNVEYISELELLDIASSMWKL